jgi:hypothetical protein
MTSCWHLQRFPRPHGPGTPKQKQRFTLLFPDWLLLRFRHVVVTVFLSSVLWFFPTPKVFLCMIWGTGFSLSYFFVSFTFSVFLLKFRMKIRVRIQIVSRYEYIIIYVNHNSTYLIKRVKPFNSNPLILYWVCGSCKKLSAIVSFIGFGSYQFN